MTITDVDFKIIRQVYTWDKIEIANCYKFYTEYLPRDVILSILELYGKKTTLKGVDGMEVEYLVSKGMLNSVYGMAVTDIVRDEITYDDELSQWGVKLADENTFNKEIEKYNNDKKRFLYYAWGVWVTAYARKNLWCGILAFGDDYVYSDTDSIKCLNMDKHMNFINEYNKNCMVKLKTMCDFRHIDIDLCKPKTKKGIEKPLGVWDIETLDDKYKTFKTLGAKRYMYCDSKGIHITIAGLSKQNGVKYIMEQCNNDINKCFEFFNNEMYIPSDNTGKNTHTYIDNEMCAEIEDYTGIVDNVVSLSSVHLEKADFTLSVTKQYTDFLNNLRNGYIYKGIKAK
jgi:hypothetical protein